MAKSNEQAVAVEEPAMAAVADTFAIPLNEFCQRLSAKKVSPEMISGFHHTQKAAGRLRESDATYTAIFSAFVKQPA